MSYPHCYQRDGELKMFATYGCREWCADSGRGEPIR